MPLAPALLTVSQCARVIGRSRQVVRNLISNGLLETETPNRRRYVTTRSVERYRNRYGVSACSAASLEGTAP